MDDRQGILSEHDAKPAEEALDTDQHKGGSGESSERPVAPTRPCHHGEPGDQDPDRRPE
jgi:hypothetical protein